MKVKEIGVFILILFISVMTLQCSLSGQKSLLEEVDGQYLEGGNGPQDDGSTEAAVNNLSVPVIWSDGVGMVLPGDPGIEMFTSSVITLDDNGESVTVYPQQDPGNSWQAESYTAMSNNTVIIDYIDWGDDLEAKSWPLGSKIRVETALYESLPDGALGMKSYDMYHIEGQGIDELWGTSSVSRAYNNEYMDGYNALIYSGCAKLIIQKITDTAEPVWSDDGEYGGQWVGSGVDAPLFNKGVWDSSAGDSGGYSAEINVGGKVIYGFNWDTRILADGLGTYRITFALVDGAVMYKPDLNTAMASSTKIYEETVVAATTADDGSDSGEPDMGGATAYILFDENITYLDVTLTDKDGKGRK